MAPQQFLWLPCVNRQPKQLWHLTQCCGRQGLGGIPCAAAAIGVVRRLALLVDRGLLVRCCPQGAADQGAHRHCQQQRLAPVQRGVHLPERSLHQERRSTDNLLYAPEWGPLHDL